MVSFSSIHAQPHCLFTNGSSTRSHFHTRKTFITTRTNASNSSLCQDGRYLLSSLAPIEAILFDIDGTLCDSDPLHFYAYREMLQQLGYNSSVPIDEEFFIQKIAGKHNDELIGSLFPDWNQEQGLKFMDDKEAMFRRLASEQLKPISGLDNICKWIEDRGLKRGAVTNAPRSNAELLISLLGLDGFFQTVVVADECDKAKPFPDPYLKGLQDLSASSSHTLVFEVCSPPRTCILHGRTTCDLGVSMALFSQDSVAGIKAGVAAGMKVLGISLRNPQHLLTEAGATFSVKTYDDPALWAELKALEIEGDEITVGS